MDSRPVRFPVHFSVCETSQSCSTTNSFLVAISCAIENLLSMLASTDYSGNYSYSA